MILRILKCPMDYIDSRIFYQPYLDDYALEQKPIEKIPAFPFSSNSDDMLTLADMIEGLEKAGFNLYSTSLNTEATQIVMVYRK